MSKVSNNIVVASDPSLDHKSTSKLTAPGRMDVVERVLKNDPFFRTHYGSSPYERTNRRGVLKSYSSLTVGLVLDMAHSGIDVISMRRDEIIAKAFEYCQHHASAE